MGSMVIHLDEWDAVMNFGHGHLMVIFVGILPTI